MLTLSKALTSAQAKVYYQKDFSNGAGNYYSQKQTVTGQWQGQLAREWGLEGEVTAEQYNRLADGQQPHSGEQLIQYHQKAANSQSPTQEHRAGWDATFSAPKRCPSLKAFRNAAALGAAAWGRSNRVFRGESIPGMPWSSSTIGSSRMPCSRKSSRFGQISCCEKAALLKGVVELAPGSC